MATKTYIKYKGHRTEKTRYHIPFYTTEFFEPEGSKEEGGKNTQGGQKVKIPIKIQATGDESRSNVTQCEIPAITHFDNNVEKVLTSIYTMKERVIKPKEIESPNEKIKTTQEMMKLICAGTATTTLQQCMKEARQYVWDAYLEDEVDRDPLQEEVLVEDEKEFFKHLEQDWEDYEVGLDGPAAYTKQLYKSYDRALWNSLHSVIFGADAYRAHKQQKDYLLNKIVKPYSVSVEAAFRRIDFLTSLLAHFPPASSRGETPTDEQWEAHEKKKKLPADIRREIKYNLLPDSFGERFDELETDWTEMSKQKFLSEAQKIEVADKKKHPKDNNPKEKGKRKRTSDDDSHSNLSRPQQGRNQKGKRQRLNQPTNSSGIARECELCKAAGAPSFVYKSHYTNQCKKKEEYQQQLSGGAGARKKTQQEFRATEKELMKELKLLKKINKLKKKNGSFRKMEKSDLSDTSEGSDSEWSSETTSDGGEKAIPKEILLSESKLGKLKTKNLVNTPIDDSSNNIYYKKEINCLDRLVTNDVKNSFANEVHGIRKKLFGKNWMSRPKRRHLNDPLQSR